MQVVSPEDLKNIFYSGFDVAPAWQVLDELAVAIGEHAVEYFVLPACSVSDYHIICESIQNIEGLGPQEKGHMALKKIAQGWLQSKYGCEALFESYFVGLHPDVCSKDYRFVMECGTTDPSCVTMYLDNEGVSWAGNLSYPYYGESDIRLHGFQRGQNYISWRQEHLSKNRAVFEKHHRK